MNMSVNNNTSNGSNGIGFFGILGIVFIVLKLVGVIDWPWWLVLAPIWGGIAIVILLALIVSVIVVLKRK